MKKTLSIDELFSGVTNGDRSVLSRAITLTESTKPDHQAIAQDLIKKCTPLAGNSIRIGITGVPGVGKSTFIEAFGNYVISQHRKLAVLAIDPSSKKTGGSILGDKTRMDTLSQNPDAFIRPSPSAGSLGGVAKMTRETIILFEAAGYDTIIVETVGVGQSETTVHSMVDCFLLLMLAGAGDELQGIKRGIMEMADILLVNKADGENEMPAKRAAAQVKNAIHLFPAAENNWTPHVTTCSALLNSNIAEVWELILSFQNHQKVNGFFDQLRQEQSIYWMHQTVQQKLHESFYMDERIKKLLPEVESDVLKNKISSYQAAAILLQKLNQLKVSS